MKTDNQNANRYASASVLEGALFDTIHSQEASLWTADEREMVEELLERADLLEALVLHLNGVIHILKTVAEKHEGAA